MKSSAVILGAIGIIILAAWYYIAQPKPATAPETIEQTQQVQPPVETDTIAYTDTGFSPQSITVKPGTTVTFFNQSSTDMWVASDVHPTHLELPEFDQLKGEAPGTTYSFTFEDVGTWGFHDHLNFKAVGSV